MLPRGPGIHAMHGVDPRRFDPRVTQVLELIRAGEPEDPEGTDAWGTRLANDGDLLADLALAVLEIADRHRPDDTPEESFIREVATNTKLGYLTCMIAAAKRLVDTE